MAAVSIFLFKAMATVNAYAYLIFVLFWLGFVELFNIKAEWHSMLKYCPEGVMFKFSSNWKDTAIWKCLLVLSSFNLSSLVRSYVQVSEPLVGQFHSGFIWKRKLNQEMWIGHMGTISVTLLRSCREGFLIYFLQFGQQEKPSNIFVIISLRVQWCQWE